MGGSPFFLADLRQPLRQGGHTSFCTSGLLVCDKTHSLKSDHELRVFCLEW